MLSSVARFMSLIAAAAIGGLVVSWFVRPFAPPPPAPAVNPPISAAPEAFGEEITQMPAAARIELGGYVEPRNVIRLSAQASGRVAYVGGQEGDRVAAGGLVAALDNDALQSQYRAAWANLASEVSALQNAQTQLYHRLYGQQTTSPFGGPFNDAFQRSSVPFYNMAQSFMGGMVPGGGGPFSPFGGSNAPMMTSQQAERSWPALNNARADYERQMAGLVGSQARLDALDAQARDRRAVSPRAGVILRRFVRVGDIVQPGQPLADIGDADTLDIRLETPVAEVSQLRLGDQVPVTVNNVNLWAAVAQIFPAADGAQRTVTVKLALPAGAPAAPGMYARAWIAQGGSGSPSALAPAVPNNAIAYRGSLPVAFVTTPHGVEMRVLRLGDTMGDRTAVLSGLQAGERVVPNPAPDLKAGDSVAPQSR
jgi:RND family efflux transporter MFP subunit